LKSLFKLGVRILATFLNLPILLSYWLGSQVLGKDRALEGASQWLALVPGLAGSYLRRAFYSLVMERCHPSVDIGFGTIFSQTGCIIEEHVYIGPGCSMGWVHLGRDVLIAGGVQIPSGGQTHFFDDPTRPIREQGGARSRITIGPDCWIGSGAIILADVGRGTIVAAGAVVTKPLPEFVIAGGIPARVIRPRFPENSSSPSESVQELP
jgi:acetyltransferase-like isoleucine patch superfamily enzyme